MIPHPELSPEVTSQSRFPWQTNESLAMSWNERILQPKIQWSYRSMWGYILVRYAKWLDCFRCCEPLPEYQSPWWSFRSKWRILIRCTYPPWGQLGPTVYKLWAQQLKIGESQFTYPKCRPHTYMMDLRTWTTNLIDLQLTTSPRRMVKIKDEKASIVWSVTCYADTGKSHRQYKLGRRG